MTILNCLQFQIATLEKLRELLKKQNSEAIPIINYNNVIIVFK